MKVDKQNKLVDTLLQNSALDLYKDILQHYCVEDVFALARQAEYARLSFRASWTLEHLLLDRPDLLEKHKTDTVDLYVHSNNDSSLRSTSKLVMLLLQRKVKLHESDREGILNKTFQLIERNDCPVALLVNCWDILLLFTPTEQWISEELRTHIYFYLERSSTPASRSRGNRILKKLERITNA